MLLAGKSIAATAIEMIENQELISQAKQELEDRLEGKAMNVLCLHIYSHLITQKVRRKTTAWYKNEAGKTYFGVRKIRTMNRSDFYC